MANGHHGVAVIITNKDRSLFYVQQNVGYPIELYDRYFSLFGGKIEEGEDDKSALERELVREELKPHLGRIVIDAIETKVGDFTIHDSLMGKSYDLTVHESILCDDELINLTRYDTEEGEGILVSRDKIMKQPFMWGLRAILEHYLGHIDIKKDEQQQPYQKAAGF